MEKLIRKLLNVQKKEINCINYMHHLESGKKGTRKEKTTKTHHKPSDIDPKQNERRK
jgi:hypothetical protein